MKNGTQYARKIKRLFTRLKKRYGSPEPGEAIDPMDRLLFGILHRGTTVARAERALGKLSAAMVDLNELRVSTTSELVELLGHGFPHATEKAKAITKALNGIFGHYNELALEVLRTKSKREARSFLEELDGVDPATAAGVMLFSLEGHALPVDEVMLTVLREEALIHPDAGVEEVQAFLERNVSASNARGYTTLLRKYSEEQIKSIAPSGSSVRTRPSAAPGKERAARKKGRRRVPSKAKKTTGRPKSRTARGPSRAGKGAAKAGRSSARVRTSRTAAGKRKTRKTSASRSR